ncbi:MAG: energy transducer TonB [bacterium]
MKLQKLILLFLLISIASNAQRFSGEIEYKISIIPKNDSVDVDFLKLNNRGDKSIYLINHGNYKNSYFKNDEFQYSYTYENVTKRMYDEEVKDNYLTFRDSRKENIAPSKSTIYKDSTKTILDKKCFLVVYQNENSVSKTYYSDAVKVDPSAFENHKVGYWYDKIKEVNGSIGLKTITEYSDHFVVYEAVRITERAISPEEFALPLDKIIVASYAALDKAVELEEPNQETIKCYFDKVRSAKTEKSLNESKTVYVSLIVKKNGEITNIRPIEEDKDELFKVAIDILQNCNIKFIPGQIDNRPVSSETYFPVSFE